MKVLHIITGLGIGGAEEQLRLLLRHLDAECDVVTLSEPGPVAEAIRADGVRVTHLRMTGNRDLSALPRLTALIRAGRYDVVHTHLYRACVYGRIAARLAGVRTVVATEHSLGASQIEGRPLGAGNRALYRAAEKLGHATFAVSETVARRLDTWGVPASRVQLAPNGVEPARLRFDAGARAGVRAVLSIPPDAYVVGGVGRQVPGKRFDILIRAIAETPGAHLLLAGDGPERVPLLRLVHSLNVQGRVHISDGASDPFVPELLSAMDLFVSASAEEAFGVAVIEALACGLPVLYAACPAIEDLPHEYAPGARRFEPGTLVTALREEHLAGPRRLPVPPAVGHYDIARTAEHVAELYARIAGRGRLFRRAAPTAAVPHPARETAPAAAGTGSAGPAAVGPAAGNTASSSTASAGKAPAPAAQPPAQGGSRDQTAAQTPVQK